MTNNDARIHEAVAQFNARQYLQAHLLFEAVWLEVRSDELKGLVQACNCLHMLEQGLYTGARRQLQRAPEVLAGANAETGIDVGAVCVGLQEMYDALPAGLETGMQPPSDWTIPHFVMKWAAQ